MRLGSVALLLAFGSACSMNAAQLSPSLPSVSSGARWLNGQSDGSQSLPAFSKKQRLLYVAASNAIKIYDVGVHHPKLVATLTKEIGTPSNPCLSRDGTLYVPSVHGGVAGFIVVYPFGHSSPSEVLPAIGPGEPRGCAVDSDGNLWVADVYLNEVYEYVKGQNTIGTIIYGIPCPDSVAFDATGNMYVAVLGFFCPRAAVEIFAAGKTLPFKTISISKFAPFIDIAIDPRGKLYIADLQYVLVYDLGLEKFAKKRTNGTVGVGAVAVDGRGRLYAGGNLEERRQRRDKSHIVEFAPGATAPGSVRIRTKGKANFINGLAAWPPSEPR